MGHIEMGRVATNCADPVVLYVSGGNTQVGRWKDGGEGGGRMRCDRGTGSVRCLIWTGSQDGIQA